MRLKRRCWQKGRRYYEPYLSDPRTVILLAAGGFEARAGQCLWEEVGRNVLVR